MSLSLRHSPLKQFRFISYEISILRVIYYSYVVRHQSRQIQHQTTLRQTDLIMRLQDAWESRELTKSLVAVTNMKSEDIDTWAKRYPFRRGLSEPHILEPETFPMVRLANFFDVVGILLHRKLIDIEMVDEMFGTSIKMAWEKFIPIAEWRRKHSHWPTYRQHFEYLYNELKKREQRLAAQTA